MLLSSNIPNPENFLFYDWYSVAVELCGVDFYFNYLMSSFHYSEFFKQECTPRNGYTFGYKLVDSSDKTWLTVYYGGDSQGGKLNAFATGDTAERFHHFLNNEVALEYALVRADVALDFNSSGVWSSLYDVCINAADLFKIKKLFVGSPESLTGESDEGRTLYLGSRQSVSFLRLYEKGKKDNPLYKDWVRLELEFKPKNAQARLEFAKASKADILNASAFVDTIYGSIIQVGIAPCSAGTVRSMSDYEKTLLHLFKQYGSFFETGLAKHKGDLMGFFEEGKAIVDKYKIG